MVHVVEKKCQLNDLPVLLTFFISYNFNKFNANIMSFCCVFNCFNYHLSQKQRMFQFFTSKVKASFSVFLCQSSRKMQGRRTIFYLA